MQVLLLNVLKASTLLCLTGFFVSGCTTVSNITSISEVKPWERGTLAKDNMQLVSDLMDDAVDNHVYFSREASTGGNSVAGGGCGCN